MSDDTKAMLTTAVRELRSAGAKEVYVFGSRARSEHAQAADLDLAVSGLPPELFYRTVGRLLFLIDTRVDLINLDKLTPFTRHLRESKELVRVG
jgi:predicted nucleotidyltransferase